MSYDQTLDKLSEKLNMRKVEEEQDGFEEVTSGRRRSKTAGMNRVRVSLLRKANFLGNSSHPSVWLPLARTITWN